MSPPSPTLPTASAKPSRPSRPPLGNVNRNPNRVDSSTNASRVTGRGSYTSDRASGHFNKEWADIAAFESWLITEKATQIVEFTLSKKQKSTQNPPTFLESRVYYCNRGNVHGAKPYARKTDRTSKESKDKENTPPGPPVPAGAPALATQPAQSSPTDGHPPARRPRLETLPARPAQPPVFALPPPGVWPPYPYPYLYPAGHVSHHGPLPQLVHGPGGQLVWAFPVARPPVTNDKIP